jgi:DNA-binding transcriptional regulator GbsR (MarR family)
MELSLKQKSLIEKMGVFHEKNGMPPTEARIIALLLVSDRIELSFDEIRDYLQISKSAASNALNNLMNSHKIEYITKYGDRKRYFRSNLPNWKTQASESLQKLLSVNAIMREILNIRTVETPDFNKDLAEVIDFIDFLQQELLDIYQRWKSEKAK